MVSVSYNLDSVGEEYVSRINLGIELLSLSNNAMGTDRTMQSQEEAKSRF